VEGNPELAITDYPRAGEIKPDGPKLADVLGPGLITGAADDDPSGIATYAQAGAVFGFSLSWTLLLAYPLMCAIQMISAEIGRVTGKGIAANMRRHYPPLVLYALVGLLVLANVINIGADLGAMGAALELILPGRQWLYVAAFAILIVLLEVFMRYASYASVLRWLTLSLFAYVATVFVVGVPWGTVAFHLVVPHVEWTAAYFTIVVAIFGTTISPYLFFWQASEEVEEVREDPAAEPILEAPDQAPRQLQRIQLDTMVGMAASNLMALRPIAGDFAFAVFALGIVGTGLLAVPVLAGSAAYALGETLGWNIGLDERLARAPAFYGAIAGGIFIGALLNFTSLDPIKALIYSAVVNGVVAVPVMTMIMHMASQRRVMGEFALHPGLKILGWIATAVMGAAAVGMFATWNG
jgi:Mn2+/Fe2+ NRAMP family transporter